MKKYSLVLPAFMFIFGLFNINVNSASALVLGCSGTSGFSPTTGESCASTSLSSCTDSDGGQNPNVAGFTDGRVNGSGSYFSDSSVGSNGSQCSGSSCTSVAEGYCTNNGQVTNTLMSCSTGYSVNGACATPSFPSTGTCIISRTLMLGSMKDADVVCLQTTLGGLVADGSFGPKTRAAVIAFQIQKGLVADGIVGPITIRTLEGR